MSYIDILGQKAKACKKDIAFASTTQKNDALLEIAHILRVCKDDIIEANKVDLENGEKPFAQVRMVAKILKIGKRQPDPDSGITYERLLIPPKDAGKTLNWGDIGNRIIELATITAKENFEFEKANENQEYV